MIEDVEFPIRDKIVLSYDQAAAIAGVSKSTLRRSPDLKKIKLSARRVGVRADHLSEWLDARVAA